MFSDKLANLLNINCPYRKFKMKKLDVNKPYIMTDIKTMIKEKHKLQKLYNRKPIIYQLLYYILFIYINKCTII